MHCTTPSLFRRQITPSFSGGVAAEHDDHVDVDVDPENDLPEGVACIAQHHLFSASFSGDSGDMPGPDGDNEEDNDNMPPLEEPDADAHDGPVRLVWLTEKFAPTYLPSSPTLTLKGKFPIHNGSHTMAPHYVRHQVAQAHHAPRLKPHHRLNR